MKKILIFYGTYGGGHIAAAKSIQNYINANYPDCDVVSVDCIEYINKYVNKISTKAYAGMAKRTPHLWEMLYNNSNGGTLGKISHVSNKIMAIKLKNLIKEHKPDLIISTHPFSSQMCAYLKKKKKIECKLATVMTDFHIHDQWIFLPENVDYFFVANNNMKEDMIKKGIPSDIIFDTGIPVSPKFSESFDREEICDEFWLDKEKFTVLLFGGGEFGLGTKTTLRTLKTIIRLFKDIQIVAISGKNKKMHKEFESLVEETNSSDRVKVLEYTDKVPELMSISEIVITKAGGLTITESLTSHLPIIIINPIPGQEEQNAEFLVKSGCAIWVKPKDNIARIFKDLYKNKEKFYKMKEISASLARPTATKDICDILLNNENEDISV